jgi:hypothetical protein
MTPHDRVEIACMEPVCDPSAASVQNSCLCLQRPFTGKRRLLEAPARRFDIDVARIHRAAARRRDILRFLIAEVGFGDFKLPQSAPISGPCASTETDSFRFRRRLALLPAIVEFSFLIFRSCLRHSDDRAPVLPHR